MHIEEKQPPNQCNGRGNTPSRNTILYNLIASNWQHVTISRAQMDTQSYEFSGGIEMCPDFSVWVTKDFGAYACMYMLSLWPLLLSLSEFCNEYDHEYDHIKHLRLQFPFYKILPPDQEQIIFSGIYFNGQSSYLIPYYQHFDRGCHGKT